MFSILLEDSFITTTLNNTADFVKALGSYLILIVGIALILVSIIHLVRAFASRSASNWAIILTCLLTGGLLTFGGWKILTTGYLHTVGKDTLDKLNEGNAPAAIGDFVGGEAGTDTLSMTKAGLGKLADGFFVPFGKALAVSVGVLLVVLAAVQIAKFFFGNGRASVSWLKVGAMCIIGSVLFTATPDDNGGGWTWIRDMVSGASKDSIINIADGNETDQSDGLTADSLDNLGADPSDVPTG